jgi:hypothetical protein
MDKFWQDLDGIVVDNETRTYTIAQMSLQPNPDPKYKGKNQIVITQVTAWGEPDEYGRPKYLKHVPLTESVFTALESFLCGRRNLVPGTERFHIPVQSEDRT